MKNSKQKELCRFNIAGLQYGDYQKFKSYKAGSQVSLFWEKNNSYDNKAIRIEFNGVKLGYVPRGSHQDLLHQYRKAKIKVTSSISSFNKNNPSWTMFVIKCEVKRLIKDSDSEEGF